MKTPSPVLTALARLYRTRRAGRTGKASLDAFFNLEKLLEEAKATDGDARELAEGQLKEAERAGILKLEPENKRDPRSLHKVRFALANEAKLYDLLSAFSPTQLRIDLAGQFADAATGLASGPWHTEWQAWCEQKRVASLAGRPVEPFNPYPSRENARLLALLPKLLAWKGESLVRFVSCNLCEDSKELELLAPVEKEGKHTGKLRGKLGRWLEEITGGKICTLNDLDILPNPRFALVHGPLRLRLGGVWLDLGLLQGSFRLSLQDLNRAEAIETTACRCLTVENETSFHELAKLSSGELLIQTSYPGSGTLKLLGLLPDQMEYWHFGDSDEAGFQILEVLRKMSGRDFRPLHMEAGRIPFEQESLGRPPLKVWPYY